MEKFIRYKYLLELNIGTTLMGEPMSTSREVICDTRDGCVDFIKKQIEMNAKFNIEECKKHNNIYLENHINHRHEEMNMPTYNFGKFGDEIVDCVVNWEIKEEINDFGSKIRRLFTKKNTVITKQWYWWYNIFPIPYNNNEYE